MLNPWMIAGLIFTGIGFLMSLDKPVKKPVREKPAVEKQTVPNVSVVVNPDGTKVKSKGKKAEAKPSAKVLDEPPGDG